MLKGERELKPQGGSAHTHWSGPRKVAGYINADKDTEQRELTVAGRSVRRLQPFGKVIYKVTYTRTADAEILLLTKTETDTHRKTCIKILLLAFILKAGKQPKCPFSHKSKGRHWEAQAEGQYPAGRRNSFRGSNTGAPLSATAVSEGGGTQGPRPAWFPRGRPHPAGCEVLWDWVWGVGGQADRD